MFKRLMPTEQFPQITPKGIFIGSWKLEDRLEVFGVFLVNLELFKAEIAEPYWPIMRIEPDHNGSVGKTIRQGA